MYSNKMKMWHAHYPEGIPGNIDYPHKPMKHYLTESARDFPQRTCMIYHDKEISFAEANEKACRLADSLQQIECTKRKRVLIILANCPEYFYAVQACYKIGAIFVPVNPRYTEREIGFIVNDSQSEFIIVHEKTLSKILNLSKEPCFGSKKIIVISDEHINYTQGMNIYEYNTLLENGKTDEPAVEVRSEDPATLQYTGATTGFPKGCVLSNFNMEAAALTWYYWYTHPINEPLRIINPAPIYHVFGLLVSVNLISLCAGTIILIDDFSAPNILRNIRLHSPNALYTVPATIGCFASSSGIQYTKEDMASIKVVAAGGANLADEVLKQFEQRTGLKCITGYGMSESAGSISGQPLSGPIKQGSVGYPLPDFDIKIMHLKNRYEEAPINEVGEIVLSGPQIMSGYWNNPIETANALVDGWLYTGDIGKLDETGCLFILDRKKDMIICNGFNIYPKEIDEVLYTHPAIVDACTIGIPDINKGEKIKSFVVLQPNHSVTEQEIMDFCRVYLTAYKIPHHIEFISKLPLTSVGKISRRELREMELEKINEVTS